MNQPALTRELLGKAYVLALFIHGDEEVAARIVVGAAGKLEVAVTAQNKRLYYHPVARKLSSVLDPARFRHKIWLSEVHLLQRLIYIESELDERLKEQRPSPPGEEDLVIHFIKHLVRITLRRNSFYVALGLSRVLYNYSTAETMEIYNAVVQDPERVKDDYYYRSRKGILMSELKDRFGDFLRTYRGPRGEERFLVPDQPSASAELVKECLSFFTPWATPCLVPDRFDPVSNDIPGFVAQGVNEEHQAEINRIHALTHPGCYQRLIRALGFRSPHESLAVPQFFLGESDSDEGPRSRGRPIPKFDDRTLNAIRGELAEAALRRKKSAAGLLRVLVDGVERGRVDLQHDKRTQLTVSKNAELLEITTTDSQGELLLATRLIADDDFLKESKSVHRIVLEGGQEISVGISQAPGSADNLMVEVIYRESSPARAVSRWFGRLVRSLIALPPQSAWRSTPVLLAVLTLVFFAAVVIGLRLYRQRNQTPQAQGPQPPALVSPEKGENILPVAKSGSTPEPKNRSGNTKSRVDGGTAPRRRVQEKNQLVQSGNVDRESSLPPGRDATDRALPPNSDRTRGGKRVSPNLSLPGVKKVFVESLGGTAQSQAVIEMLSDRLRATGRFDIPQSRDEADAVLKVAAQARPSNALQSQQISVRAMLVNANGDILWPRRQRASYVGSPAKVAASIVTNLLNDIRRLEAKP